MKRIALILAMASSVGCIPIRVSTQPERLYEEKVVPCVLYNNYNRAYWNANCVVDVPIQSKDELAEIERRKKKYGVE